MKTLRQAIPAFALSAVVAALCAAPAQAQLRFLPGDAAVAPAAGDQTMPAIALGGNATLAVWTDNRANPFANYAWSEYATSRDIYGMRFDVNGNPLDALPIAIFAGRSIQDNPKVAWNGSNWLVVFESYDLNGTGSYYQKSLAAVRVAPGGKVLDAKPILIPGITPSGGSYWALASDGTNWVIAAQGSPTGADIVALRISPAGVVIDTPARMLVEETYYGRSNLQLAYAGGVFLLTFGDAYNNGVYDTKAVRFDSGLNPLNAGLLTFLPTQVSGLAAHGGGFYAVWHRQETNFAVRVVGSRVNTSGQLLDGAGVNISGSRQPGGYATTAVAWDGVNWRVTWGDLYTTFAARVTSAGTLVSPGSVAVAGPQTGLSAGTGTGGVQLVWVVFTNNGYEVYSANITSANAATPNRVLSIGAPQQLRADAAAGNGGYLIVCRSVDAVTARVLAQPLDAAGQPLTAGPVQLDVGPAFNGPGSPNVAWNGSLYLAAWGTSNGVVAQRLAANGAKIDPAPFMVMPGCFGPADVAALGSDFLVSGRKVSFSIQYIFPVAARVSGAGTVLDASPLVLGNSYVATAPAAVALGGRWLVAWHRNATHDDSYCISMGAFVPPAGSNTPEFQVHGPFSTAGGNGIFEVGLGSSGDKALFVQSQELTSGVENDMLCRVIDAAGTVGPATNLTPWAGNQYRPRVAWDGASFVVAYQDQRNRLAPWTLDQLDARSDLFAMRVSPAGARLDPQGFVISASPVAETDPNVCAANGSVLLAGSLMVNGSNLDSYRVAYDIQPRNRPVAVINASAIAGDIPLAVSFDSTGSSMMLIAYDWNFGDGGTASGPAPSHTFTVPGEYLVTLTVTDEFGRKTTQARMVNATKPNVPPVAVASADRYGGNAPLEVVFSARGSYDPDGFLGNLEWSFSDGGIYYGATAYHTFTAVGNHTATLRVHDSRGAVATATVAVAVSGTNAPPVAIATATPTSGSAPLSVQFRGDGSFDPDGTIVEYDWAFGDAFGTRSAEPNPTYTYGYAGTYPATLTVRDNNNVSRSTTVTISVAPAPSKVLRSTAISLSAKLLGRKVTATGNVTVKNAAGAAAAGAIVYATWTMPGGATVAQTALTGSSGTAKFSTSGGRGTYTLTVNNISKTDCTFDAANSVLSASITK